MLQKSVLFQGATLREVVEKANGRPFPPLQTKVLPPRGAVLLASIVGRTLPKKGGA